MRKSIARRVVTSTLALVATAALSIGSATEVWAKTSAWDGAPATSDRKTSAWD